MIFILYSSSSLFLLQSSVLPTLIPSLLPFFLFFFFIFSSLPSSFTWISSSIFLLSLFLTDKSEMFKFLLNENHGETWFLRCDSAKPILYYIIMSGQKLSLLYGNVSVVLLYFSNVISPIRSSWCLNITLWFSSVISPLVVRAAYCRTGQYRTEILPFLLPPSYFFLPLFPSVHIYISFPLFYSYCLLTFPSDHSFIKEHCHCKK